MVLQGAMHAATEAQGHGQSFEHLVEHAAAQHSQHAYGQPKAGAGDGLTSAGSLARAQPHKPPQATKSSRLAAPTSLESNPWGHWHGYLF